MIARQLATVVRFELQRSATVPRLAWWLLLMLFPVLIVLLVKTVDERGPDEDGWTFILFTLIPLATTALALLLWATPIVQAELETNTWSYLAVRPHGRLTVLLGKYLTALLWTIATSWGGLTLSILLVQPNRAWHIWFVLSKLVWLSAIAYGALFTFLGVLVHKRPAVAAVAYGLIFEVIVATVPAVINQFTIQFRLRTLLNLWYEWRDPPDPQTFALILGSEPPAKHVAILLAMSAAWLIVAAYLLCRKSLVTASDV